MINKLRRFCFAWPMILASILFAAFTQGSASGMQDHDGSPIELSGFSISEAYEIPDDRPLDLDAPILKQLLYRIKNTSPQSRQRFGLYSQNLTWQDVNSKTEDFRLWLFDRPARLKKIEKHRFRNLSPDEEVTSVFVCYCETDDEDGTVENGGQGRPFLALSRTIPKAIPIDVTIDEPIRVAGFLYARVSGISEGDNNEMPVFITDRIAWFPSRESENVSAAHLNLSNHGVDIGLMDSIRENNALPLDKRDAEAFFQVLAAVNRMNGESEASNLAKTDSDSAPRKLGFNDLMQNANANFGQRTQVVGTVRTCSVISVPHTDIQNRMGLSTYYQLMLFPDLDGAKIVVRNKDGNKMDYRRFPITICCTELPPGMSPQDMERKQFVVDGYFFRFWKFQSEKTDQAQASGQVSPLIIAKRPILIESNSRHVNFILMIIGVSIVAGIVALIGGYRIADRMRRSPVEKILDTLPEKLDLTGIED